MVPRKQHAKFIHRVHSISSVVDYLAFDIGPSTRVKFRTGNISIELIFT